ncbi:hypothetical protein B0H17DRAFT_1060707 [Mycena rosella]|uniref:Uncharacterized protein n=1 Tax=Mycena rosella TaxID=1033263 RepID=A0AAD7DK22_MYCRO|nr:hypothetical protein B0H17DRAFT_1060707 [Mycena rosella]
MHNVLISLPPQSTNANLSSLPHARPSARPSPQYLTGTSTSQVQDSRINIHASGHPAPAFPPSVRIPYLVFSLSYFNDVFP